MKEERIKSNKMLEVFIQPVLVIYNMHCLDSVSLQSLLKQGLKPIVVDNSTIETDNAEYCEKTQLVYIDMQGNAGLSKAYNKALDFIKDFVKTDYVLWLDDDTEFPRDYVARVTKTISEFPNNDIYLPLIKTSGKGYLSPNVIKNLKTKRINNSNEIGNNMVSAINSGMIVNSDIYNTYRYDENLFLDCIDHDFMVYCQKENKKIFIDQEIVLFQHFSGDERTTLSRKLSRHRIYSKDYRYFRKKHGSLRMITETLLIKRKLHLLVQALSFWER